jgi:hypothetical protein
VVEFPGGTVTKSFLTAKGLSITGVTRMMPALAAWVAGGRRAEPWLGLVRDALVNGTDPRHPDYWLASPEKEQNQRQVESSVVAWSVWLLRDKLLPRLNSAQRRNIAAWLASCTRRPVRTNNWAWFTAVNQACRLALAPRFPEFAGDEDWMREDLEFLWSLRTGDEGWFNDAPKGAAFDYYNSWVFASHFLYWNAILGSRYPEWSGRFGERLKKYLETAPLFFAPDGAHVLYGRSLIYRWGVLTPLVLAYQQGLWPHSPGLLKGLVERNVAWHRKIGGFDRDNGKLRETFTPEGAPGVKESYIDGGHPYWGMQAFALWMTPPRDPFWRGQAEPAPAARGDFARALPGPGLFVWGNQATGEVRLFSGRSYRSDLHYRDKYNKFTYSSRRGFCCVHEKQPIPHDCTLLLRGRATGETAGRGEFHSTELRPDGVDVSYTLALNGRQAQVFTRLRAQGAQELWEHRVAFDGEPAGLELVEGGWAAPDRSGRLNAVEGWEEVKDEPVKGHVLYKGTWAPTARARAARSMRLVSVHQ